MCRLPDTVGGGVSMTKLASLRPFHIYDFDFVHASWHCSSMT
ncbi:hypothetical protein APHHGE2_0015 [Anaplasma phagocytophilum str. HGE2]|nr:hypothetical protein APHWEB_0738 [Anaplasma phagocytophilum str. Webster]KJV82807.1 hypothetical protein APHHGE2_0015 [Anaplasma phagocytophilum str. HGE2]